jgi:hypothetical protein
MVSRNSITPRIPINKNLYDLIGRVLNSNCFSTFRGRLVHVENERCYFELLENKEYTKYNHCAGQVDYLPEHMVVTMKFED